MGRIVLILYFLAHVFNRADAQKNMELHGQVSTQNGKELPGATIQVLNTGVSTVADGRGYFTIAGLYAGNYKLKASFAGYMTVIIPFQVPLTGQVLNIRLRETGKQLEEVIVTAQKSEERAQELALSLTALHGGQIQDYRLWNIRDLTAIVPNLYAASPGDNRNVTAIRGITTTSYDQTVATYIDGVNQFGLDTYLAQLEDVERIEVLRGPQGTLYGRNAMGGVVNIITRQPDNRTRGFAELTRGNYGLQRYNLAFRTPLIKDQLFLGVSALYSGLDGYYFNTYNQTRFDDQHSFSGNYFLRYQPFQNLKLTLNVKHAYNRNAGTFPLAGSFTEALERPYELSQDRTAKMVDNLMNASLSANYTGKYLNWAAQTAYQSNYRFYKQPIDADFSPLDLYSIVSDYGPKWNNVRVLTQELRISPSVAKSRFSWISGAYAFLQWNPVKQGTYYGPDAELAGLPAEALNMTAVNTNNGRSSGVAFFGQGTYSLTAKLGLIFGMRYDFEHKQLHIRGDAQLGDGTMLNTVPEQRASANFHAFSPKAGLQYFLNPQHSWYATYSRGYRSGGISQLGADPQSPPLLAYQPEFSDNFELGSKNTFADQRLRLNFSLFYTLVNNAQVPALLLPEALTVTRNAGKLRSRGAEIELAATPLTGLQLSYSAGLTSARYRKLNVPADGQTVDLAGRRQVFTPDGTSMCSAQYAYRLGKAVRLSARSEWLYIGERYFDLANQLKQAGSHLWNARLGLGWKKAEVTLWGANLTNARYVDYAYDFGPAHLANPRTYGISVRTNF